MDVITIESKAYKEIVAKIDVIANYVFSQEDTKNEYSVNVKVRFDHPHQWGDDFYTEDWA